MKSVFAVLAVYISIIILTNCDTAEPPPLPPASVLDTVTVNIIDQTHRSLTVEVKTTVNNKNWQIELWRNYNNADTLAAEFPVTVGDTTIIDDNNGTGLLLDTEYGYYAVVKDSAGEEQNKTATQTGRTLAATSHNYTWEEHTIGEWQSVLYDVWGTDENNAYAVGTVMINDTAYGVLHWDGSTWKPEKRVGGVEAIYGFSENDIWAVGGAVEHYDGTSWKRIDAQTINNQDVVLDDILYYNRGYTSLWGTSSSNLYLGNGRGKIIHWDGKKAEVELVGNEACQFNTISGYKEDLIIAVGYNGNLESSAYYKLNGQWESYTSDITNNILAAAKIINPKEIYLGGVTVTGSTITLFRILNNKFEKIMDNGYLVTGISYNNINGEIAVCGNYDGIHINNGIEWKDLKGKVTNENVEYSAIKYIGNKIFVVGMSNHQGKILIGK